MYYHKHIPYIHNIDDPYSNGLIIIIDTLHTRLVDVTIQVHLECGSPVPAQRCRFLVMW